MKYARGKKIYFILFHLYEVHKTDKSIVIEVRIGLSLGRVLTGTGGIDLKCLNILKRFLKNFNSKIIEFKANEKHVLAPFTLSG